MPRDPLSNNPVMLTFTQGIQKRLHRNEAQGPEIRGLPQFNPVVNRIVPNVELHHALGEVLCLIKLVIVEHTTT